jgi:hypothetical protein
MSSMKSLGIGILIIIVAGIGGLIYRNVLERSDGGPTVCQLDATVCPDGTTLGRSGPACEFPACPPPNVSLEAANIAFVVPNGFSETSPTDAGAGFLAEYRSPASGPIYDADTIVVRRYPLDAASSLRAVIEATAIGGASEEPVPANLYSSFEIGARRYTVVPIERFEATIHTAYYVARGDDVLRFDAVDRGVPHWMDPALDIAALPAHAALREMLATLQGI